MDPGKAQSGGHRPKMGLRSKWPTVEVVELWTVFHEHDSLLGQSSNMGCCISTDQRFAYPKEFFEYLAYLSSYTHFIVSIIP